MIKITFEKKGKKTEKNKVKEFSKKALTAMIVMWFVGAVLGIIVVCVQTFRADYSVNLSDLLMYIGAPMTGGIVSYMLKSAFENREKIKNSIYEDTTNYQI